MNLFPSTQEHIVQATKIENIISSFPQKPIVTWHSLYDGVYTRTMVMEKGEALAGALIKIPTTILINGYVKGFIGGEVIELNGFNAIPAPQNRKQIFYALEETTITMIFKTNAQTVDKAEEEFTDDFKRLLSRNEESINIINMEVV